MAESTDLHHHLTLAGGAALQAAPPDPEGWVHSWELEAGLDGPGWRFVLFLSGCPLRCVYCHNPDTWVPKEGQHTSAARVAVEIAKYAPVLRRAHGGVTLTGGEPLIQQRFAAAILSTAKAMTLSTAIETSGASGHVEAELLDNLDLAMVDIKSAVPATYRRITGHDPDHALAFLRSLTERGIRLWLRFVLVPDLTDSAVELDAIAALAASLPTLERVEVLAFHQMGAHKWHDMGVDYPLDETPPADLDDVANAVDYLRARKVPAL
ncbi:pyruvate formate-lyase-activating protein [Magnetospirillum sp. UT-4]|uniref:pyruvate formate-lyase-activating protein n=1 Tax=Magnetospirillum sp. UT-4 TaxID=2681467 RepID=UPI001381FA0A|nr:pyruvate formate-lyase-activating protein [Magnetospirillum sp. UT-4]CAA7613981.1 Pyruvate formate-lyase activating enzyme [Magnetospirillum sp. UT-4]